jgi:hypothetical protein
VNLTRRFHIASLRSRARVSDVFRRYTRLV